MKKSLVLSMLAGVLVLLAAPVVHATNYALLVGVNDYWYGGELYGCVNDANDFRATLLTDSARWKAGRITRLVDNNATKVRIKRSLRKFAKKCKSGDQFVFFFSGHGGRYGSKSAYLCCVNSDPYSYQGDLKATELASELARFRKGVHIVCLFDSCHSAGMFKSKDAGQEGDFADSVARAYRELVGAEEGATLKSVAKSGARIGYISACTVSQTSEDAWFSSLGASRGVFTYFYCRALRRTATDAVPRNGYVSFREGFLYARHQVPAAGYSQRMQTKNPSLLKKMSAIRVRLAKVAKLAVSPSSGVLAGSTSTLVGSRRPRFTWSKVSGATHYQVQLVRVSSGKLLWTHRTAVRHYTQRTNLPNGTYRFRVRAQRLAKGGKKGVSGGWSSWKTFVVRGQ